jgi:hypothetical protein
MRDGDHNATPQKNSVTAFVAPSDLFPRFIGDRSKRARLLRKGHQPLLNAAIHGSLREPPRFVANACCQFR